MKGASSTSLAERRAIGSGYLSSKACKKKIRNSQGKRTGIKEARPNGGGAHRWGERGGVPKRGFFFLG